MKGETLLHRGIVGMICVGQDKNKIDSLGQS